MRLYQRGKKGIWWIDWGAAGVKPARCSTGTTDRAQAQEYAAKAHADHWRQTRLGEKPQRTWDEAVIAWVADNQHLRDIEHRKDHLRYLTAHLRGKRLAAIDADLIKSIIDALRISLPGVRHQGRPAAPATINRYMASLLRVLNFAREMQWLAAVPYVAKLKEDDAPPVWLTPTEAVALLDELAPHLRQMARMALATGMREANVRLLTWDRVDTARALAWVHAQDTKARRNLAVPLNEDALAVLREQRGQHGRYVFTYEGQPIRSGASNNGWYAALRRAGTRPGFTWHGWRHTWATWHVLNGTPLRELMDLGGWSSYEMVLVYAHMAQSHLARYAGASALGTNLAQTDRFADFQPVDNAPNSLNSLGWLMGLEPTTTGITKRQAAAAPVAKVFEINELLRRKKRDAA
ncbi:MAG: tyrosine-type recombinase/integrase [Burkholderiaceae bacterium]